MKPFVLTNTTNIDASEIHVFDFLGGKVGVFSAKNPQTERDGQDSCAVVQISKDHGFLIVADGMGGHRGGGEASKMVAQQLTKVLSNSTQETYRELVLQTLEKIHLDIQKLGVGAGSAVSIAEINNEFLRFYTIGDCMAFHLGGKGLLKYKNVEHSLTGYGVEAGFLTEAKALKHEDSHVILNSLGHDPFHVELSSTRPVSTRDIVLVASDGLSANLFTEEMVGALTNGPMGERLQRLITKAYQRMDSEEGKIGNPDDLTIILFAYDGPQ